jgi:hypothetical protein
MHIEQLLNEITELKQKVNDLEQKLETKKTKSTVFKEKSFLKWPVILLVIVCVILMTAADISGDKITFAGGTTISATEMNDNFTALFDLVNGNIDSFNLAIDSVGSDEIAASAVGASELASDTVSLSKVSGGTVVVDAGTSRIGIGTTDPQNRLDVEGNIAVGATYSGLNSAPGNGMIVEGSVGIGIDTPASKLHVVGSRIILERPDDVTGFAVDTWASENKFALLDTVNNSHRITVANDDEGNVGIGTTSPTSKLHIGGYDLRIGGMADVVQGTDGYPGEIRIGGSYIYLCSSGDGPDGNPDTWRRVQLLDY